jgi:hypothetical protein
MSRASGIRRRIRNLPPSVAFWCFAVAAFVVSFGLSEGPVVVRVIVTASGAGLFILGGLMYLWNRHHDPYAGGGPPPPAPFLPGP